MLTDSQPEAASAVLAEYKSKARDLQSQIDSLRTQNLRVLTTALKWSAVGLAVLFTVLHGTGLWMAGAGILLLGWAVALSRYLGSRSRSIRLAHRMSFYERGMERMEGNWHGKGAKGLEFAREDHLYQADLDILGEGSLFELLATTRSQVGAERLAAYLLDPASAEEARARQEAVRELRDATDLREEIALLGKYRFQNCEGKHLRAWLGLTPIAVPGVVPLFLSFSGIATLALGLTGAANLSPWLHVLAWLCPLLAVQAGIGLWLVRRVRAHLRALLALGGDVTVLRQGAVLLERQQFECAELRGLVERLRNRNAGAALRELELLATAVERREDAILYGFSLWLAGGTQLVLATERWRGAHQREFEEWMDAWAEFEALSALGGYAYEHPADEFPELLEGEARFEASELRHPLLPRRRSVGNDVMLNAGSAFYLVSGSNMAGKSTLLRAMGLNAVLAAAGAPVCGRDVRMSVFNVCASIAISDSMAEGKSKFLAEVERLRASIRVTEGDRPVLFLIDEILSGTNSRDRRMAAESVLAALAASGAVGALSTHDLALTEIAAEGALGGVNVHMQSENPDEPLAFDYRLKPGVLRQTNALAIVKMLGISR
jgi:hypothetical protein